MEIYGNRRLVKAEVRDKDCYEKMLKIGVNCGFFHLKVSKWIDNKTQLLQSYKCLEYNHRLDKFQLQQKCFICSENHDFKLCPNKCKLSATTCRSKQRL
jgi:hypothetical protein